MTSNKELRKKRAAQGVCTECGGVLDTDGRWCARCRKKKREYKKQDREWYLAHGICPECGKEKLFGQERSCLECRAKMTERTHRYKVRRTEEEKKFQRERDNSHKKTLYWTRKEEGVCVKCGKRKPEKGKAKCRICLNKYNEWSRNTHKDGTILRGERPSYGMCYVCGDSLDGRWKLCTRCRNRQTDILLQSGAAKKGKDASPWNKDNELFFNRKLRMYCETGIREGAIK